MAFLGCLYAGVIAVPSPLPGRYAHQQRRVAAIALDVSPGAILTTAATLDEVRAFAGSSGQGQVPLLVLPLPDEAPTEALRPRHVDALAMLQYTSGSTGRPKGVMLTNGNIVANVANLVATFGLTAQTRLGGWVPHYHDMGLMALILPAWYTGSSVTMMSPAAFLRRPVRWLEMVDNRNLTWSAGPNFAYDQCTRTVTDNQIASLDLANWRCASNGSEPVRASILEAFAQRFAPAGFRREALNPCYGLAEATVFVSGTGSRAPVILRADEASLAAGILRAADTAEEHTTTRDLVSNGTVRGLEILVVDPDSGEICGDGQIGELWLRGTSIGAGYWRNPGETERVFNATTADGRSGYLRTGDLGAIRNGELFVTGRIKELIIVRGRNIYPQDIEHLIREEIPALRGLFGAAFSVAGADGDELLTVIHEIGPSTKADRLAGIGAEIRQAVARETGVNIMGLVLVRRGTVRRTTSGKIQRLAMRDLFQAGEIAVLWSSVHPSMPTQPLQAPPERAG